MIASCVSVISLSVFPAPLALGIDDTEGNIVSSSLALESNLLLHCLYFDRPCNFCRFQRCVRLKTSSVRVCVCVCVCGSQLVVVQKTVLG
jgi:hypothetical protein